jgi:hypothetical protein
MSITAVIAPIAAMPEPVPVYVKIDTKETKKKYSHFMNV